MHRRKCKLSFTKIWEWTDEIFNRDKTDRQTDWGKVFISKLCDWRGNGLGNVRPKKCQLFLQEFKVKVKFGKNL